VVEGNKSVLWRYAYRIQQPAQVPNSSGIRYVRESLATTPSCMLSGMTVNLSTNDLSTPTIIMLLKRTGRHSQSQLALLPLHYYSDSVEERDHRIDSLYLLPREFGRIGYHATSNLYRSRPDHHQPSFCSSSPYGLIGPISEKSALLPWYQLLASPPRSS
jgi:hypothetical protein